MHVVIDNGWAKCGAPFRDGTYVLKMRDGRVLHGVMVGLCDDEAFYSKLVDPRGLSLLGIIWRTATRASEFAVEGSAQSDIGNLYGGHWYMVATAR